MGVARRKQNKVMVMGDKALENEDMGPPWLISLLNTTFYTPCKIHGDSNKSECNMYCLECMGHGLCSYCLGHHKDHYIVQIRKSSYQNAIRVSEVQKFLDISGVQTYIINSAKIVFLKERPQKRPGKGISNTCDICCWTLLDSFRFCSLRCKLEGMKRDPEVTLTLGSKHDRALEESESDESSTPKKIKKTLVFNSPIGDNTSDGNKDANGEKSIINYRTRRRKGIPHRAPFL
ncbi:protein RGF1 INDUCIBLE TRANSCRIPTION FACTOR 1-like [Tasmannia lanceolata]|uniref:protein RGF1 INDUCIBLE TRANSCRIPTION FACTOR 1-like n=1 Tax=Tasmannia lanceolata TaxID=3420 RepID=UPI00406448B5